MSTVKKPGYMMRAVVAWIILHSILLLMLMLIAWILQPWMGTWYVMLPLLAAVIISEWIITGETIAPIIKDWISQEEYVSAGEKPSWEKDDG